MLVLYCKICDRNEQNSKGSIVLAGIIARSEDIKKNLSLIITGNFSGLVTVMRMQRLFFFFFLK